jgi:hypothetical protein
VEAVVCLANRIGQGVAHLVVGVEDDGRVSGARMRHDMRVVLESEAAIHSNKVSVQSALSAAHGNFARSHIEEAQVHADDAGVHRNLSPMQGAIARVQGNYACLQSDDASA